MTTLVSWQMVKPNQPLERVKTPLPEPGDGEGLLKLSAPCVGIDVASRLQD